MSQFLKIQFSKRVLSSATFVPMKVCPRVTAKRNVFDCSTWSLYSAYYPTEMSSLMGASAVPLRRKVAGRFPRSEALSGAMLFQIGAPTCWRQFILLYRHEVIPWNPINRLVYYS